MIESPLPYVSHKTAPFRAHVLCGNRSSGVQPISVNRQPCSCLMEWSDRELTAFENLTLGLYASDATAPIVVKKIRR